MIQNDDSKIEKKRIRGAHVTTVLSISVMLLLLCMQGLMLGYTRKISDYVKENIGFTLMIKDYTREQDILDMKAIIDRSPYVKSSRYISKDSAAQELKKELGQDFVEFLGYNPLLPSIEINLKAEYTHTDSIAKFEEELTRYHIVKEMYYQPDLVKLVNDNVSKIIFWLSVATILLLLITIYLINSTMQLLIYSKRFNINTMQLVGATASFIRKPFIIKSMIHGAIGALIAIGISSAFLFYCNSKLPAIINASDVPMIIEIFVAILIIGIVFTMVSAGFAVNKYLRMRNSDKLYN